MATCKRAREWGRKHRVYWNRRYRHMEAFLQCHVPKTAPRDHYGFMYEFVYRMYSMWIVGRIWGAEDVRRLFRHSNSNLRVEIRDIHARETNLCMAQPIGGTYCIVKWRIGENGYNVNGMLYRDGMNHKARDYLEYIAKLLLL